MAARASICASRAVTMAASSPLGICVAPFRGRTARGSCRARGIRPRDPIESRSPSTSASAAAGRSWGRWSEWPPVVSDLGAPECSVPPTNRHRGRRALEIGTRRASGPPRRAAAIRQRLDACECESSTPSPCLGPLRLALGGSLLPPGARAGGMRAPEGAPRGCSLALAGASGLC